MTDDIKTSYTVEKSLILDEDVQVGDLLARELLRQHGVDLGDGIEAAEEDVGERGAGVDEPLAEVHGLGVASEGAGHEGGVVGVAHAPVDVGETIARRHEGHQARVLLEGDEAADLIREHGQRDDNIDLLRVDDVLNLRMEKGTSRCLNANVDNLI